jgi:hypothetical protein
VKERERVECAGDVYADVAGALVGPGGGFHLAVTDRPSQHITAHSSFSSHLHSLFSFMAQLREDRTMLCRLS